MPRAFLTPEDTPTQTRCWRVFIPDSLEFEAIFRGHMLALQKAYNWEQYGSMTPEECAAMWEDVNTQTFLMTEC